MHADAAPSHAEAVQALPLEQALECLLASDASEGFSALTGRGLLLLDLRNAEPRLVARLARGLEARPEVLTELPCPSIALAPDPLTTSAEALVAALDLRVPRPAALAEVLAGIQRSPLASLALVQLLRGSEERSVAEGLLVESLAYAVLQAGPEFAAWRRRRPPSRPPPAAPLPALKLRREAGRLHVTLNRPERRNALSVELRDGLVEALGLALCDASIEEIVLDGAGPDFCSGGDLAEFGSLPDPATAHAIRSTRSPARLLAACADRCRVELHGACIGAGAELAAFAGHVVARRDARFQLPELAMGLIPGAGGSVSLPRRIGRQRTAWLALSGTEIDAPTALAWGLVDALL